MSEIEVGPDRVAQFLPAKARRAVYAFLSAALAVEAIWDVVPDGTESRLLATLAALGFVLSFNRTGDPAVRAEVEVGL